MESSREYKLNMTMRKIDNEDIRHKRNKAAEWELNFNFLYRNFFWCNLHSTPFRDNIKWKFYIKNSSQADISYVSNDNVKNFYQEFLFDKCFSSYFPWKLSISPFHFFHFHSAWSHARSFSCFNLALFLFYSLSRLFLLVLLCWCLHSLSTLFLLAAILLLFDTDVDGGIGNGGEQWTKHSKVRWIKIMRAILFHLFFCVLCIQFFPFFSIPKSIEKKSKAKWNCYGYCTLWEMSLLLFSFYS
jgi:hypothetical protein